MKKTFLKKKMKYSKAKVKDIEEIYSFSKEVLDETWSKEEIEKSFNIPYYEIYKGYDKEITGVIHFTVLNDEATINFFAVKKERQNEKIGTNLLFIAILKMIEKGALKCVLEVNKNNKKAIEVYKKEGFLEVGVRKNFYKNKEDALVFELKFL